MKLCVFLLFMVSSVWSEANARSNVKEKKDFNTSQQPNIIFILADDLGWSDVGFHGAKDIRTPNIDALAAEGIVLNNYYVERICTPSRCALLTGLYPSHTGMQHFVIDHSNPYGLPLAYEILPQKLNQLNYISRIIGKWHLGFHKSAYTPLARGFHSHYGFWPGLLDYYWHNTSNYIEPKNSINAPLHTTNDEIDILEGNALYDNLIPVKDRQGDYLTEIFTEEALDIIRTHKQKKPLFLYLAHHAVHRGNDQRPVTGPPETDSLFSYIKSHDRRNLAGAVKALDDSVGKVVEALQERGMLNNTIIVFSSDNGADVKTHLKNGGSNWPLRGQKHTSWEGAIRSVGILWYPGVRPRVSEQLMHIVDWMPTLYRAAGGEPKNLGPIDGMDLWQALKDNLPSPRHESLLVMDSINGMQALRLGRYKVVKGTVKLGDVNGWYDVAHKVEGDAKYNSNSEVSKVSKTLATLRDTKDLSFNELPIVVDCKIETGTECEPEVKPCLFDLLDDPCERNNIADQKPEILEELMSHLEKYKSTEVPVRILPKDYLSNPKLHGGFWTQWQDINETIEELVEMNLTKGSKRFKLDVLSNSVHQELQYLLNIARNNEQTSGLKTFYNYFAITILVAFTVGLTIALMIKRSGL